MAKKKIAAIAKGKSKHGRRALRTAMILKMKQAEQRRRGNKVGSRGKEVTDEAMEVPITKRAGHPLVPTPVNPADWKTVEGKPISVDLTRVTWLPDDWGQGVKMTNPISRSRDGFGGTYTVWISPEGRVFYHRKDMENFLGRKLGYMDGFRGQLRLAQLQGKQTDENKFFQILSPKEKRALPRASELHFCVISARRTQTAEGLQDIAMVQSQFLNAGVEPTWYVDEPSLRAYRQLGLKAVVGGKLTAARNKALKDAQRLGKACVQISDDISRWEYFDGAAAKDGSDEAANAAFAASTCHIISPVVAARFLLAKLRGAAPDGEGKSPQLAGVYMLGNCSRSFGGDQVQFRHFILGDFFVVDKSSIRFDEEMTLKEDYDFTAQHIYKHGSVIRCNRMVITAKHQTNAGGACSTRDKKGLEEQRNIAILFRKWPRAFRAHPKRKNEVVMHWPSDGDVKGTGKASAAGRRDGEARPKAKAKAKAKGLVKKDAKLKKAAGVLRGLKEFNPTARVAKGWSETQSEYIRKRREGACGKTVQYLLEKFCYKSASGVTKKYKLSDLRYDVGSGGLKLR